MHSAITIFVLAGVAFFGVMVDDLFILSGQLLLTPREGHHRILKGQFVAILSIVGLCALLSLLTTAIPLRWFALLALAPLTLAARTLRNPTKTQPSHRHGTKAYLLTLGSSADNIAVWLPLLREGALVYRCSVFALLLLFDGLFLLVVSLVARHPRLTAWGERFAPRIEPVVYLVLSVFIVVEVILIR